MLLLQETDDSGAIPIAEHCRVEVGLHRANDVPRQIQHLGGQLQWRDLGKILKPQPLRAFAVVMRSIAAVSPFLFLLKGFPLLLDQLVDGAFLAFALGNKPAAQEELKLLQTLDTAWAKRLRDAIAR